MWGSRRFTATQGPLVVFTFGVSALSPPLANHAQATDLDRFVGKDLWKQRLSKNDLLRLDKVVGKVPNGQMTEPVPWHIWKTDRNGQTRYVILLGEWPMSFPGGSSARIQLFDNTAKRINSWSFPTGWRNILDDASIEYSKDLESDLIVLHTARMINGRDIAKEYFAINDDRIRFVRMESDIGEVVQNEYVFPNFEIDMVPDANTVDQWANLLESEDKADVLSALVFLGGRHVAEPERRFLTEPKQSKYAGLFQQLIGSTRIRELIERLSKSGNEWIRQAAVLAARGPRERLFQ